MNGTVRGKPASSPSNRNRRAVSSTKKPLGHDLWLTALKEGKFINGSKAGNRKPGASLPQRQGVNEYWKGTLRRSETVVDGQPVDSFTGLSSLSNSQTADVPYLSTSHYLRQVAGTEKPNVVRFDPTFKPPTGTPQYKSPEEYYDEILDLKRQMNSLRLENETQKSRARRLEEDNLKKEKQLASLLDPTRNEELRRSLADKKDSGLVVLSLKQKLFRLEQQIKEKDSAYTKLQTDIKYTKVEEMKLQLEVLYNEVIRLRHAGPAELLYSRDEHGDNSNRKVASSSELAKTEALARAVKKMNEEKGMLMQENITLRQNLEQLQAAQAQIDAKVPSDYADMNRHQLLTALLKLEKQVESYELGLPSGGDVASTNGKIVLTGDVRQRLNQLDQRESELLNDVASLRSVAERYKEEKKLLQERYDEKCKEIDRLEENLVTARRQGLIMSTPKVKESKSSVKNSSPFALEVGPEEEDNNTKFIQSAIRGYQSRENFLNQKSTSKPSTRQVSSTHLDDEESIDEDSVTLIQAALRGHQARHKAATSGGVASSSAGSSFALKQNRRQEKPIEHPRPGTSASSVSALSARSNSISSASREGIFIGQRGGTARSEVTQDSDDDVVF